MVLKDQLFWLCGIAVMVWWFVDVWAAFEVPRRRMLRRLINAFSNDYLRYILCGCRVDGSWSESSTLSRASGSAMLQVLYLRLPSSSWWRAEISFVALHYGAGDEEHKQIHFAHRRKVNVYCPLEVALRFLQMIACKAINITWWQQRNMLHW